MRVCGDGDAQFAILGGEAECTHQVQATVDLMRAVGERWDGVGEHAAAKHARLSRTEGNAGEVARIRRRVWSLRERGADQRRVEASRAEVCDQRQLAPGVERERAARVLPERASHHHLVEPGMQQLGGLGAGG